MSSIFLFKINTSSLCESYLIDIFAILITIHFVLKVDGPFVNIKLKLAWNEGSWRAIIINDSLCWPQPLAISSLIPRIHMWSILLL